MKIGQRIGGSISVVLALTISSICAGDLFAQTPPTTAPSSPPARSQRAAATRPVIRHDIPAAITRSVELLIEMQEGPARDQWPYEGVYRVNREIPVGYRIGGTAIAAMSIVHAMDTTPNDPVRDAVQRALRFVIKEFDHPLMNPKYDGGYDVRGWGYTYGLQFLLLMRGQDRIPQELRDAAEQRIRWLIAAIEQTEIPRRGGWNYARPDGWENPSARAAPFMTGPTLLALYEARRQRFEVDPAVVERALRSLEQSRNPQGALVYSGTANERSREEVPGAVGRMLVGETALFLAGRSNLREIRGAIDAFIVHWDWLDQRRAKTGTHEGPYGVAPYYFYFAHWYCALAIEQLPERERHEYRRRLYDLLFSRRLDNGTWNDRVFPRSANYGTALAILTLTTPKQPALAKWEEQQNSRGTTAPGTTPPGEAPATSPTR